jgi:adenylate cyclase
VPAYWRTGRLAVALGLLLLATLATFLLRDAGRADALDRGALTWRFTVREWLTPRVTPDPDVVLVQIDERSLSAWPEPIVGWGRHFADALDRLHASGARVVAFDWIQDQPAEKYFPGGDTRWADAITRAGNVVMAKASAHDQPGEAPRWIVPAPQLLYALPNVDADLGYVELTTAASADTLVTAMKPVLADGEKLEKSLVVRILERYFGRESELRNGTWRIPGKVAVPLREDNSVLVNYPPRVGSSRALQRVSLVDVARGPTGGDARFRDKIVLVGATYTASGDFQYVPVREGIARKERRIPGVEIHAALLRTLLSGRPIREPSALATWGLAVLLSLFGLAAFYRLPFAQGFLLTAGAGVAWIAAAFALFLLHDYALPLALPLLGLTITGGGLGLYRAVREEGERRQVLGLWGRYQDPRLVEYLLRHPEARGGEGREQEVTVLFADLKNFTKTVESLSPADALKVLNRYLGLMAAIILEHGGVVDKYLGDGLMAQWGAPEGTTDHAAAAVRACQEIERRVGELTQSISAGRDVTFGIRLTLHTGPVVVGWVGATRLEFTLIGDTVNVTSRLQETAKELDCEFLISESTWEPVRDWVKTGKEAEVAIRGRLRPLRVYEVVAGPDGSC